MISELHKLLTQTYPIVKPAFIREWERDLDCEFSGDQLAHLYQLTHSSAIDSKTQQNNYRILTSWYHVPAALVFVYSSVSDLCWRGCCQCGTFLHIWWDCPAIQVFWKAVKAQITEILDIDIPLSPVHFLLHVPTVPLSQYKQCTLPHLLNAAKSSILICWMQTQIPGCEEWTKKVNEIMEAE